MRKRIVGIIIKEGKALLMRRVKRGREYYVFPGGGVEDGEGDIEALRREIQEELSLTITAPVFLFEMQNEGQKEVYYLIKKFTGVTQLGGPEKERMNEDNQYYPEWLELLKVAALKNLFPREAVSQLRRLPDTHPD